MSDPDLNTTSQIVEDTIFYHIEIVLFLSDTFPPEDDSDAHPGTPEQELTPSGSTATPTPEAHAADSAHSAESSAASSILGDHADTDHLEEVESDVTVPDDDSDDGAQAHAGDHGWEGGPLLAPQEPGAVAPPGTPVGGAVSQPVGAGFDLGSIIAHAAQFAHLAPPAGAGTPMSEYYGTGTPSVSGHSSPGASTAEEHIAGPAGAVSPVDPDDPGTEPDIPGVPNAPTGAPNSAVLAAGVPNGPDGTNPTGPAPQPPRRPNLNAASAPFVPSGTDHAGLGTASSPPQETPSHPQGPEEGGAGYAPGHIYSLGPNGTTDALPLLSPRYVLGEAMAWEADFPHGISEARGPQVAASPYLQHHIAGTSRSSGGYGVGGYGGRYRQLVGGGSGMGGSGSGQSSAGVYVQLAGPRPKLGGYDGSGPGGQFVAGGYILHAEPQPEFELGFNGSRSGQFVPAGYVWLAEPQPGLEPGFNGPGSGGQCFAGGYEQRVGSLSGFRSGFDGSGPGGLYPERRYVLQGEGRIMYELRADGSYTVIGHAPPEHRSEPEPEPELEPETEQDGDMPPGVDVPMPPPGHHVAIAWGDGKFRYLFLENADDDDDKARRRPPGPPGPPGPPCRPYGRRPREGAGPSEPVIAESSRTAAARPTFDDRRPLYCHRCRFEVRGFERGDHCARCPWGRYI